MDGKIHLAQYALLACCRAPIRLPLTRGGARRGDILAGEVRARHTWAFAYRAVHVRAIATPCILPLSVDSDFARKQEGVQPARKKRGDVQREQHRLELKLVEVVHREFNEVAHRVQLSERRRQLVEFLLQIVELCLSQRWSRDETDGE